MLAVGVEEQGSMSGANAPMTLRFGHKWIVRISEARKTHSIDSPAVEPATTDST